MRKLIKTKWGTEIIFSEEDWFIGSFMQIGFGKFTEYENAAVDTIYYVQQGSVEFVINGTHYEFREGKTLRIIRGTKYQIIGTRSIPILIKIAKIK